MDFSLRGPIRRHIQGIDNYTNAYFYEDLKLGEMRDNVICQDITKMTFESESFDIVTTTDIMEHVDKPWQGFKDVHRILKKGGSYIFTIPVKYPMKPKSITRATLNRQTGELTHLLEPVYHNSGEQEPSLVFTDFGSDMFPTLKKIGFATAFISVSSADSQAARFGAFLATKF